MNNDIDFVIKIFKKLDRKIKNHCQDFEQDASVTMLILSLLISRTFLQNFEPAFLKDDKEIDKFFETLRNVVMEDLR